MVYTIDGEFLRIDSDTDAYAMRLVGRTDDSIKHILNNWFCNDTASKLFNAIQSKVSNGVI